MRIKFGDIMIGLAVAAVAVLLIISFGGSDSQGMIAVITKDSQEIERINLEDVTDPVVVDVGDNTGVIITAEYGRIRFTASDCPDQTCVNTGWIDSVGETAVCLPNRVMVKIIGEAPASGGVDIIAE